MYFCVFKPELLRQPILVSCTFSGSGRHPCRFLGDHFHRHQTGPKKYTTRLNTDSHFNERKVNQKYTKHNKFSV